MAACAFLGELDWHPQNLGAVDGKIVKIDHGRSGYSFYTDAKLLLEGIADRFHELGYGGVPFNLELLKEAVKGILYVEVKI